MLGLAFGFFYLFGSSAKELFINPELIKSDASLINIIIVINRGLYYFYSYPAISEVINSRELVYKISTNCSLLLVLYIQWG